jgi:hypothetical protein
LSEKTGARNAENRFQIWGGGDECILWLSKKIEKHLSLDTKAAFYLLFITS